MQYVYYSHSMRKYNTPDEARELRAIAAFFPGVTILNPNGDMRWTGSMEPYHQAARDAYRVVCSEFCDRIGRGVYEEIMVTHALGHPVYLLRLDATGANLYAVTQIAINNPDDWSVEYGVITGYTLEKRLEMV